MHSTTWMKLQGIEKSEQKPIQNVFILYIPIYTSLLKSYNLEMEKRLAVAMD